MKKENVRAKQRQPYTKGKEQIEIEPNLTEIIINNDILAEKEDVELP